MFPSFPLGGRQGPFTDRGGCGREVVFVGCADDGGTDCGGEGRESQGGYRPVTVGGMETHTLEPIPIGFPVDPGGSMGVAPRGICEGTFGDDAEVVFLSAGKCVPQ